jgi:hypothetical protein
MLSRRELLQCAALSAGALALGRGGSALGAPAAPAPPRRCLSMGPAGVALPGSPQDLRTAGSLDAALDTGSTWVKLWAPWPSIQPLPPAFLPWDSLAGPVNPGAASLAALDAQVGAARAAGLGVIVCSYQFPAWTNGTAGLAPGSREEIAFAAPDRMSRSHHLAWLRGLRPDPPRKALAFQVPDDRSPDSDFGRWIGFLLDRYGHHGDALMLEVVNEPGLQMWPQQAPGSEPFAPGAPVMPVAAAELMQAARVVSERRGHPCLLGGPATDDGPRRTFDAPDDRLHTGWRTMTTGVLEAVGGLAHRRFAWTHHAYADATDDRDPPTRAGAVASLVAARWRGAPGVWLTEGGVRLDLACEGRLACDPRVRQAELLIRHAARMASEPGIEMVTQYLDVTDPAYDSGIRDPDGARRPAYAAWRSLPSRA